MSEKIHELPKAKIQKDALSWFFWMLPVGAAALCGWFLLHDFILAGPTITIYFQQAQGLQAQNSMVKYRGINIGQIESLKLVGNGQLVAVRAKLRHSAAGLARQGSVFWIVRPELKLGAISGLRTIVSGDYITLQPGGGGRTNVFIGAEEEPIQPIPSLQITLLTDNLDSLENQSPIFYRGIQVGEVMDFRLGRNAQFVVVRARIRQDYAPLVRVDSKFWNAGGINVHVGLFSGLEMNAESAQTLVSGGIAFATPPNYGPPATNGTVFYLFKKEDSTWEDWNPAIMLGAMPEGQKSKNSLPQIQSQ